MADWLKGFDPLKGVDLLGGFSRRGSFDGVSTGLKIGSAINRTIANSRMRKRLEEEQRIERERLDQTLANPPPVHGSAKWATASELAQAGLLQPLRHYDSPSSLLLGSFRDPELANAEAGQLHWDGEGHLLTVAPTRSGKSTTTIVPNLVRYKGSCVVLDPKGELYRDTAAWRRHNVGPVYRIAPFEKDTDSFNPLLSMSGFSDARMLADLIMPVDPRASDFFRKDALAILSALFMYVAEFAPPDKRTLAEVRAITAAPVKSFGEALRGMATCGNPSIANAAQIVLGKNPERSLPALRETLNTELSLWDDPGIQRATSTNTVDFRSLKDTPATVYVTVPFPKMEAYAAFLKITLTTALEAMLQNERVPEIPVLFVLDEFLALGPFPKFRDAIRTHAGAGVRLWFFLQDVPTLEEHYPTAWKTFFNTSVKMFFGTDETFTGRLVSEFLGDKTGAYATHGLSVSTTASAGDIFHSHGSTNGSVNSGAALAGRPLLTPQEVVRLLSGSMPDQSRDGLAFIRGVDPIKARLVPWFRQKSLQARVGERSHKP